MKKIWIVGVVSVLAAGNTFASCKQSDAKGNWTTYQAAVRAPEPHAGECKLSVDKSGNVLDGSFCSFFPLAPVAIPTNGKITVAKDCSATVNLTLGEFAGTVQISKNKQIYAGRWTNKEGIYGTTTGVKQ